MQDAALPSRHLPLPGTRNLRDVGGYQAAPGRRTRWRTLLRSDSLDRLPAASQAALVQLGLRQAIDLRWPEETVNRPSVFVRSERVRYLSVPLLVEPQITPSGMGHTYRFILDTRGPALAAVAQALLEPHGTPAVVGCAAGVDRTGVTVALLLSAVGVSRDVVVADYAASAEHFATDGVDAGLDDWRAGPIRLDCLPEYMHESLEHLDRQHGGAVGLLQRHGLSAAAIDRLGEILTEPDA
jgi:protein-tyrosine phosphatase